MNRNFTLLIFCVLFVFVSCKSKTRDEIPIESFFNTSDKSNFRLSPNGKFISYIQKYNGIENLYVMDLENDAVERITNETDIGIRLSFWANDEDIVFLKHRPPGDSLRLMSVNRKALSVRYVLPPSNVKMRWVGPQRVNNRNELLVSLNSRDSSVFDVYRIHIADCTVDLVVKNPGNIVEWVPDNNGKIRAAISSNGHTETILYRDSERDAFTAVMENNFKTTVQPLGFSAKKHSRVYALSNLGRDKKALVEVDLLTGKEENILFIHPDVDVSKGGYSWRRGDMNFAVFHTSKLERHFFNKELEDIFDAISAQLKGYVFDLEGSDSTLTKFLVRAYTDVDPGAYYHYDREKNLLRELAKANSSLNPADLSPVTNVKYFTNDGTNIEAYLTLPKESSKRKLPVIVIPHNGPASRAVWSYDAEVQFLVSRGFAVFQPNYRGSTGYGKEFWASGFKEWGKLVQEDIKEGVEWLIEEGIADPKRIGIYGFNFGGYSALHGACFNSAFYTCAASYSGMTNLYTYLKEAPPYVAPYMEMYYEMIGDPRIDGDYLRAFSPVFHAKKVKIPLFIAQGGKDYRNNVNEMNMFIKELRKNGTDVTYMLREEEGNVFRIDENRVDFYKALEAFFEKHLLK